MSRKVTWWGVGAGLKESRHILNEVKHFRMVFNENRYNKENEGLLQSFNH